MVCAACSNARERGESGHHALTRIDDPHVAGATGDALYRHGMGDGANLVRGAINDVEKGAVKDNGPLDKQTIDKLRDIAQNREAKEKFLEKLGDLRQIEREKETLRNDYFRYRGRF